MTRGPAHGPSQQALSVCSRPAWRAGVLADFRLPEYGAWLTAKKLFLFPLAASGDAVGAGAVLGAIAVREKAREDRDNLRP